MRMPEVCVMKGHAGLEVNGSAGRQAVTQREESSGKYAIFLRPPPRQLGAIATLTEMASWNNLFTCRTSWRQYIAFTKVFVRSVQHHNSLCLHASSPARNGPRLPVALHELLTKVVVLDARRPVSRVLGVKKRRKGNERHDNSARA